jgi:acetate kinase
MGNYYVKLNGQVDAVVFAGGIGEKSALLRQTLADKLECLGVAVDTAANEQGPGDGETVKDISAGGGKGPRVLVCQTNEQVSCLTIQTCNDTIGVARGCNPIRQAVFMFMFMFMLQSLVQLDFG